MTKLLIKEEILNCAHHCPHHFKCVEGHLCNAKAHCFFGGNIAFIECHGKEYCSYKMDYGGSKICLCPVRKEIVKLYQV